MSANRSLTVTNETTAKIEGSHASRVTVGSMTLEDKISQRIMAQGNRSGQFNIWGALINTASFL